MLLTFITLFATTGFSNSIDLHHEFNFKKKLDLFSISSTVLTDSEVRYSILVDDNYKISQKQPVIAYRYYLNSKNYRKLNWAERTQAYGIKSQLKNSNDACAMYLDQYPELKISIFVKNKKAYPLIRIDNKVVVLQSIKAKANKGLFGIPEVEYVDIKGYDVKTKQTVTKRIKNEE